MTEDEFKDQTMQSREEIVKMWLRGQIDSAAFAYYIRDTYYYRCPLDSGSILCACPKDHEA